MENQLSKKLNSFINSWKEYKEAELDWKDGLIDSNTLFEYEWYHDECEQNLIFGIEIEIIKDDLNYFD